MRQIVHVSAGGTRLRLRLSNRYGEAPLVLTSITVGHIMRGLQIAPDACPVSFAHQPTLTLGPGADGISDPVALPVSPDSDLAITWYVVAGELLTGHRNAVQTSYISGVADQTKLPEEAVIFAYPLRTHSWWGITGIEVEPSAPLNAVVAFGSSTTDGVGSSLDANCRWPDYLARRLQAAGLGRAMAVLNAGLSGNRLTEVGVPATGEAEMPPYILGEAGNTRMAWDVMGQAGATDLIVHIGSNDLRFGVPGTRVIEGLQAVVTAARPTFRRVFGTTILPGGYPSGQWTQRQLVNAWLRQQGTRWFDAVLDPVCDSGDGIHPNDEGYRRMAATIDLAQLTGNLA